MKAIDLKSRKNQTTILHPEKTISYTNQSSTLTHNTSTNYPHTLSSIEVFNNFMLLGTSTGQLIHVSNITLVSQQANENFYDKRRIQTHTHKINRIADFSKDEFISCSLDGTVRIWNKENINKCVSVFITNKNTVDVSFKDNYIFSLQKDGSIYYFDTKSKFTKKVEGKGTGLCLNSISNLLIKNEEDVLYFYDLRKDDTPFKKEKMTVSCNLVRKENKIYTLEEIDSNIFVVSYDENGNKELENTNYCNISDNKEYLLSFSKQPIILLNDTFLNKNIEKEEDKECGLILDDEDETPLYKKYVLNSLKKGKIESVEKFKSDVPYGPAIPFFSIKKDKKE